MKTPWGVPVLLTAAVCLGSCRDPDTKTGTSSTGTDSVRVTVVPFETIGDSGGQYFGVGLASEVERSLQSEPGVIVYHWSQTPPGKAASRNHVALEDTALARLGAGLGATHVLAGTIRRDGSRTAIAVKLVRVRDVLALWSGTYWRETAQLQPLPSELTTDVAAALKSSPKLR